MYSYIELLFVSIHILGAENNKIVKSTLYKLSAEEKVDLQYNPISRKPQLKKPPPPPKKLPPPPRKPPPLLLRRPPPPKLLLLRKLLQVG